MRDETIPGFLTWVADRFVHVYGESQNVDFVARLRHEAQRARIMRQQILNNEDTYQLVKTDEVRMDGHHAYLLQPHGKTGKLGSKLYLTDQQAQDLGRQLDAPINYFND